MSCIPADRLLQTLKTQVPGVTDDMLNLQLYNVVDEFLRRTMAWKVIEAVDLLEDQSVYDLPMPSGAEFVRMVAVSHNGVPIPGSPVGGIVTQSIGRLIPELVFPDGDGSYAPVATDYNATTGFYTYSVFAPEYVQITFAADEEARKFPLMVTMAAALGTRCLECECGDWPMPEWMWNMYFQVWLDGTLARFYLMPFKPWSSPKEAVIHGRKYRDKLAYHKQESARGFVYDTPNWRFPRT